MSKEKQIEEIAEITSRDCGNCNSCKYVGMKGDGIDCIDYFFANTLYNAGYRKQSEVALEIFDNINTIKKEYASGNIDGNELFVRLYLLEKKYTEGES